MNVHATLAERLLIARKRHPDNLKAIAAKAGYTPGYVSCMGRRNPTIGAVWAVAGALGVDPFWLLGVDT